MGVRPFALVFAGGGARGFAHVGVLRGLELMGLAPSAIVGVSMGSVVAVTYGMRDDWYEALLEADTSSAPAPGSEPISGTRPRRRFGHAWRQARAAWSLLTGWGAPDEAVAAGRAGLERLIGSGDLEDCRIPVTACATDLLSGTRVELDSGPAVEAVLASSSLAGVFPPVSLGRWLLVDGVYSDMAPVDVARTKHAGAVIVVDPTQPHPADPPRNGLQVVTRAMEICHQTHAQERIRNADLVVHPIFDHPVDVLEFEARRMCVQAGITAVRAARHEIRRLLGAPPM